MEAAAEYIVQATRAEQDRRGCIRTFTGRYVNPLQLRREDICIEDIAHHLSNICRYTGACPEFYSVAQHSVYVSTLAWAGGSRELALAGLLHDAAEAYLGDVSSPLKHGKEMAGYRGAEYRAEALIFDVFGLDPNWQTAVKEFDDRVFLQEAETWWGGKKWIVPCPPAEAKAMFLKRYSEVRL